MIVCFEGPSAIGKSTLCNELKSDFTIIPEVNDLYDRPIPSSHYWYYDCQKERVQLSFISRKRVIWDGDVFQPIWYNWTYGFPLEYPSYIETIDYYEEGLDKGSLFYPDLYVLFKAPLKELYKRKELDQTRGRRNFEKHIQLIESQQSYFKFLLEEKLLPVEVVTYNSVTETKIEVLKLMERYTKRNKANDLLIFKEIAKWIKVSKL